MRSHRSSLSVLVISAGLMLAYILAYRDLHSCRLDSDSLNAMAVFYLGRVPVWLMLRWLGSTVNSFFSYEPVTNFCYWLIYGWLKIDGPQGFRWFEVLLQVANAGLVAAIASFLVRRMRWAVVAGFLYLVHPMHVQWSCIGVPHYLATFFVLSGLLLHLRSWPEVTGWGHTLRLGSLYLLSVFSKESAVFFPLFILIGELLLSLSAGSPCPPWKQRVRPYLGLLAVALFYVWVRDDRVIFAAVQGPTTIRELGRVAVRRLWDAFGASLYAPVILLASLLQLFRRRKKSLHDMNAAALCLAWFILGLALILGVSPVHAPAYIQRIEGRLLFLPMAGLCWLAATVMDRSVEESGGAAGWILTACALALVIPSRASLWADRRQESTSIKDNLIRCGALENPDQRCLQDAGSLPLMRMAAPEDFVSLQKVRAGSQAGAMAWASFFSALPFDPQDPKWRCLAETMLGKGDLDYCVKASSAFEVGNQALRENRFSAAADAYDSATRAWPAFTEAYFQRARALSAQNDRGGSWLSYDRARRCPMAYYRLPLLEASFCRPARGLACSFLDSTESEDDRGSFSETGRAWLGVPPPRPVPPTAVTAKQQAERHPKNAELWLDLAAAAAAENDRDSALRALSRAEGLHPGRYLLERMARLSQNIEDYGGAVRALDILIGRYPFAAGYWNDRGVAMMLLGDRAKARQDLERTISLDPDFLPAYLSLGGLYAASGRSAQAMRIYAAALRRPLRRGEPENIRGLILQEKDKSSKTDAS